MAESPGGEASSCGEALPGAIGVFDSGVGGLTVVAALRRRLPRESILYLGDTARLPYGTKSPATVTRYTERNLAFLSRRGVKAVVLACNTASALALPNLSPELPTWGVIEPGARRAIAATRSGRIGVVATESTVRSDAYPRAIRRLRGDLQVFSRPCPLFVSLVEEGWLDDDIAELTARRYLEPLLRKKVDTLVLGCTHYPLLAPVIQRVAGPSVDLVDSAAAVAEAVAEGLGARDLLATEGSEPRCRLCVTDAAAPFERVATTILSPLKSRVTDCLSLELVEV